MLPPKLAQIMINLARGATDNGYIGRTSSPTVLLDPFCGTGVVLQEAALMGFDTYGTDLEPRMIDFTKTNLAWLKKTHRVNFGVKLEVGDATNYTWTPPINLVATETYLGQPYSTAPPSEKLQHNITTCNTIISKFLTNLATQIAPETGLCIAVPCWFLNNKTYHLPLTHQMTTFDYEQIFYTDSQKPLVYHRENQIVGRELLILRKKSAKMDSK
jgi:tRNA G10  N-methylase Trm11